MGPRNECQSVVMVESLRDILPKGVTSTSGRDPPSTPVIGVGPEQVAHGSFMRNFLDPVESPDVVEGVDARGEAAVKAEDLVVDEGGEREVVEQVGEILPHIRVSVLPQALVVETVHLRNLSRFVVSAQDGNPLGVPDLEGDKEGDRFDRVIAPINVITCSPH